MTGAAFDEKKKKGTLSLLIFPGLGGNSKSKTHFYL